MPKTQTFHLPDELATKLESLAKQQNKPAEALLADIVSEYIEVTEFIQHKEQARNHSRRKPKVPHT
jgi:predicted transcriptional regulator